METFISLSISYPMKRKIVGFQKNSNLTLCNGRLFWKYVAVVELLYRKWVGRFFYPTTQTFYQYYSNFGSLQVFLSIKSYFSDIPKLYKNSNTGVWYEVKQFWKYVMSCLRWWCCNITCKCRILHRNNLPILFPPLP